MRLRFRLSLLGLLAIAVLFMFAGLYAGINSTEEYGYFKHKARRQKNIDFTPNGAVHEGGSLTSGGTGTAVNQFQRIVYNRVPKCGSRSLLMLFKFLGGKNNFRVIEPAQNYPYQLQQQEQIRISDLMGALRTPFIYHRHMHYLNFQSFGGPPVVYINLIRDPLSRSVSHFYYRRHGDDKARAEKSVKNQNTTYDECVMRKHSECVGNWGIFFIVPFFCGHSEHCRSPTRWALNQAKKNTEKYLVIGILEEFDDLIKVLEKLLPSFFHQAYEQSKTPEFRRQTNSELTLTRNKKPPSERVVAISTKNMKLEYEFYNFIKERFHKLKRSLNIK